MTKCMPMLVISDAERMTDGDGFDWEYMRSADAIAQTPDSQMPIGPSDPAQESKSSSRMYLVDRYAQSQTLLRRLGQIQDPLDDPSSMFNFVESVGDIQHGHKTYAVMKFRARRSGEWVSDFSSMRYELGLHEASPLDF